jgi:hypothetical protein
MCASMGACPDDSNVNSALCREGRCDLKFEPRSP